MNHDMPISELSRSLITIAAAILILAGMKTAAPLLGPLFFSIFLAVIFGMLLHWFEKKGLSTRFALLLTLLVFLAIIAVFIVWGASAFLKTTIQYVSLDEAAQSQRMVQVLGKIERKRFEAAAKQALAGEAAAKAEMQVQQVSRIQQIFQWGSTVGPNIEKISVITVEKTQQQAFRFMHCR